MVIARAVRGIVAMVAVRAPFGLEGSMTLHHRRAEAAKHVCDDVIPTNPESVAADLGRHMTVAEMPRESHELTRLWVSDVDDGFGRRSNHEPRPVIELHTIAIRHGGRAGQIQKYLVTLIGDQANTPTMPMVKIERDRAGGKLLRPFTSASMNDRPLRRSSHVNTRSSVVPSGALTRVHR